MSRKVFVDTSALYAMLSADDLHHEDAVRCFETLHHEQATLVSTNYVVVECASLIQRRRGFEHARTFLTEAAGMLDLVWIDAEEHRQTVALWTAAKSRALSLVDCSSMAVMRTHGLQRVVAFDRRFAQAGFELLPQADRVAEPAGTYRAKPSRKPSTTRSK